MRTSRIALVALLLVISGLTVPVHADFVVFTVPTTSINFVLQGKATLLKTQPLMNFTHVSKAVFDLPQGNGTEVITLPSLKELAVKRLVASKGSEADTVAAAAWALEHGQLAEFHRAIDQLLAANASHPFGTQAKLLKDEFAKPLPENSAAEAALLKTYAGTDAKIVKSNHFLALAPPTVNEKGGVKRKRPEARLEQLEHFLEVFVMKCAERGLPVHLPKARIQVSLTNATPSSNDVGLRTRPRDNTIFWSPSQKTLYINEAAKIPSLDPLKKLNEKVTELAAQPRSKRNPQGQPGGAAPAAGAAAPGAGIGGGIGGGTDMLNQMSTTQLQKLSISLQSLMAIGVENIELESISRETAYLFTHDCGVLPDSAPLWLKDGLATYFELPVEVGWVRIGDIGTIRNAWYQATLQDPERLTVTDIVCGKCYAQPQSPNDSMRATTLSWALVHYLLQTRPEGITKFLAGIQTLPPDLDVPEEVTMGIFDESFGEERGKLEEAWREYMRAQKAEYLVLKADGSDTTAAPSTN